ncbi:transporter, hydrophobe/amphiphile efflux-1 (HAE1) family [Rhodopirellula maiorica SM1]|uniref:Transporter, hydrophobe/amphiphile efflux-1 (HAE1) family n=1 Tax=Rhodopirellula maiorica SM1 TaxID=1265738 RepID=M5R7D7_9BACT|nr:multidrug efflux RND transporter permease subunit [Rhodopirellula maiorica]EMI15285.1 transporter, hydrophobe/amphiphile efflux-1 (HAE1) family [Rhodopirellula maiorica SM1]
MISNFFINRPVAANVIAFMTVILGIVGLVNLPVERYPNITPPTIQVTANYPGASAQVMTDTVAAPLEQQINGVENMLYMQSTSSSNGSYSLTVTFEVGTDLEEAQVLVQNRVALAEPFLPADVRQQGISVRKQSTNILLVVSLTSPDNTFDSLYLSNYANLRLKDELSRVEGVGDVTISGTGAYSMRIWADPTKMDARGLTFTDLMNQLQQQNVQVAAGQIAQPPLDDSQAFQYTMTALGRLSDPKQFEDIIVKVGDDGSLTYLRDVARVELGAQTYDTFAQKGGISSASVLIYQLPGANALDVAEGVKEAIADLSESFPTGLKYDIPFDTTIFVSSAIHEVYKTLFEAGVLVLIVILVFLQNWRAVLIPATTVPVTIIGAFAIMPLLGFSVNLLTLFGLVLAIGIVVDDAIVIVENASHHIERGESPKEATIRAMSEVTGPVIGITAVLMAVFIPTAFMAGITGQLYRQFALTIAATAFLSAVNALTLKPAQCALWLKPAKPESEKFFLSRWFNRVFGWIESLYVFCVRGLIRGWPVVMLAFVFTVAGTVWWYQKVPTGFLPTEDQGYLITAIQLPDAASQDRTREVVEQMNAILAEQPGVKTWFTLGGMSLLEGSQSSNAATMFIGLKDWEDRTTPELQQGPLIGQITQKFSAIKDAFILVIPPPAIQGLGTSGGFEMQVEDRGGAGLDELQNAVNDLLANAAQQPELQRVNSTFRAGVPQLYADVDRAQVLSMQVPLGEVFATLQAALGSTYVNDFNKFGRTYRVTLQADAAFRDEVDDVRRLNVRNAEGEMVSLGSLIRIEETFGPQIIRRFNLYPSANVTGSASPGTSSGEALQTMARLAKEQFPESIGFDWSGVSLQESQAKGEELYTFALAVLIVYLVLAFLYESWVLPFAVILVVPLGLLGTVAAIAMMGMDNNTYVQIGVVLIIALASKNAILIVEFARDLRMQGSSIREAAVAASRMRFRPILMTSFAFILGVLPLVFATGAAAASRRSLGTAVCGGMITSTVLAVFFTPVFYVVFQWISELRQPPPKQPDPVELVS